MSPSVQGFIRTLCEWSHPTIRVKASPGYTGQYEFWCMIKNQNTTTAGNGLFPEMQLNDPRQFFGMIHPVNGLVHMGNDLPSWFENPDKQDPGNLLFLCTYQTVAAKRNLRRAGKTAKSNPRLAFKQFLRLYDNGEAIVGTWPGTEPVFDFCIASLTIDSL